MNARRILAVAGLLAVILAAGCAPHASAPLPADSDLGSPAGFWKGLWHGLIVLFTFLLSLFNDSVAIYEVHNKGGLYDLGFLLGVIIVFGGGSGGACKKNR